MRFLFVLIFCGALSASPLLAQESSSTVPPAAAESGKDVVHALNNAFAKVFEIVAPSVVIIEVSKKNDGNEGFKLRRFVFPRTARR
jgi:S1-C subfamily serine protease